MRFSVFLAVIASAGCNSEFGLSDEFGQYGVPQECGIDEAPAVEVAAIETCLSPPGGFNPIVEWEGGVGESARSTAAVADLNGDGLPEVIVNLTGNAAGSKGDLVAFYGDGRGELWRVNAQLGYASGPVVGDIDKDGRPEILVVKAYGSSVLFLGEGSYSVVCYDSNGLFLWESATYGPENFDYGTGLILTDMDHDGNVEIVAGRVILRADGSERGVGEHGSGSWGRNPILHFSEAALPAVSDLDLDGQEEVIVGNARYDLDGNTLFFDPDAEDGMIAVANLDDDPEGEIIVSSFDTVRAVDTDGTVMWGPIELPGANIVSHAAIADLDRDGSPEIVVAGGNYIYALRADGTELWSNLVTDRSGATGASFFDFEGDGILEVVYMDEVEMVAYDGMTGAVKFYTDEHSSGTMMDYPVIADVDADGQAEIIVSHDNYVSAFSVYGDEFGTWAPARAIWNQHAYFIDNINDDLSIPVNAPPNFTTHNTWHSAIDPLANAAGLKELSVEVLNTCEVACFRGNFYLLGRVINRSESELPAGIAVSLYAISGPDSRLITTLVTESPTSSGSTSEVLTFNVSAADVRDSDSLKLVVDDDGTGSGQYLECDEENNHALIPGPFCAE